MTILGLEFSSDIRGVAVARDGRVLGRFEEQGGRYTHAFALIEQAISAAGTLREDIDVVAVGLGPGSYTGIRIAISVAQGWQLARPVRVLGVSTVDCLVAQAHAAAWFGPLHVAIDAHRNEFYHAAFDITADGGRTLTPLHLATLDGLKTAVAGEVVLCGPDMVGQFPGGRLLHPNAGTLATLASTRTDFLSADQLQPIYLREVNFVKSPPSRIPLMDDVTKP